MQRASRTDHRMMHAALRRGLPVTHAADNKPRRRPAHQSRRAGAPPPSVPQFQPSQPNTRAQRCGTIRTVDMNQRGEVARIFGQLAETLHQSAGLPRPSPQSLGRPLLDAVIADIEQRARDLNEAGIALAASVAAEATAGIFEHGSV